jgi:hypothetical protein
MYGVALAYFDFLKVNLYEILHLEKSCMQRVIFQIKVQHEWALVAWLGPVVCSRAYRRPIKPKNHFKPLLMSGQIP